MKNLNQLARAAVRRVRGFANRVIHVQPAQADVPIKLISFTAQDLDEFVARTDALGGPNTPGSAAYWATFRYTPTVRVDESLDPFGDAYYDQQLKLYEEMSGRTLDQVSNEQCEVDVTNLAAAPNPYNHATPAILAGQLLTLATVCHVADTARGSKVLDLGCGWGLSSEMLAYCGFDVDAVDINPGFVDLVNTRAKRLGLPIRAVQSGFDNFVPPLGQGYAFSLFYECFHHATKPWVLMRSVATMLEPGGKFILAREPVQATFWRHWGLRLDALSVYCIRKFGWFESGWSLPFLEAMFLRNDLRLSISLVNGVPNEIFIGHQRHVLFSADLKRIAPTDIWWHEADWIVSRGDSSLSISLPSETKNVVVTVGNYSNQPMALEVMLGAHRHVFQLPLHGRNVITVPCGDLSGVQSIRFISPAWCPNDRFNNGDMRVISLHFAAIQFRKY
jgi:2-polyprenyl-3-methyl-5-hydroxy-6-metoxy-1,4-benzoquinol methylase